MRTAAALVALTGCSQLLGLEDFHHTDAAIDAPPDAMEVMLSGKVLENSASANTVAGATLTFTLASGATGHSATSDSTGAYMLAVPVETDGYVLVQHDGDEKTFQYLAPPVTASRALTANLFTPTYIAQLANHAGIMLGNSVGFILLQIRDGADVDLAGATVHSTSGTVVYNGPNGPDMTLTATDPGGIVTVFNVQPGNVTLTATFNTTTTAPRTVTVSGGSMTLLPILVQ